MDLAFLKRIKQNNIFLGLIVLVSLLASIPLLRSDFFHFSDENHIANLFQMVRAIVSGQFPPRWAPDMSYEYGYPLFNFYYPLPFYVGSLFYFLTGSLVVSLKIVFFITIPISGIFMFLWLKKHTDNWAAFSGGIIYIFTPYRAVDLYVRGALGEAVSFALMPLAALFVYKVFKAGYYKNIALLAFSICLLILGHNLAPLIFLPWLILYAIFLCLNNKSLINFWKILAGIMLGVLLSAYWWLPAFLEKNLLRTETPFSYIDHFPFIKQLIYSPFEYGASNPGPGDDISFQVGIMNWLLIFSTLVIVFLLNSKKKLLYLPFIGGIGLSLFLMNIRSSFIWEAFSLANYFQFPWRLLLMITFLTSALVIFLGKIKAYRKIIFGLLSVAVIVLNISYFQPSEYFSPDDNYFLKRFFARNVSEGKTSDESLQYKNYSEDYLLLPEWVKVRPSSLPTNKITSNEVEIVNINENSGVDYSAEVKGEGLVEVHNYYFPGWKAEIDGEPASIQILEPLGNMGIDIPEGKKIVRVYWQETNLRRIANTVSLLALSGVIYLLFKKKK